MASMLIDKINSLPKNSKILDVGGWFKTFPPATHVVDMMPWATRNGKLQLQQLPEEKFSEKTWHQVDFLSPGLRLPFEDKSFDFSICGDTLEDLENPEYIMKEMIRVSREGYIKIPSRLHEQTVGVRDNSSNYVGHPHHHWIVDVENNTLVFNSKKCSKARDLFSYSIPLTVYRNLTVKNNDAAYVSFYWTEEFKYKFMPDDIAEKRAIEFKRSLSISRKEDCFDALLRYCRRLRGLLFKKYRYVDYSDAWPQIVEMSRPYSSMKI